MLGFTPPCLMMPVEENKNTKEAERACVRNAVQLHNLCGFTCQGCVLFQISNREINIVLKRVVARILKVLRS